MQECFNRLNLPDYVLEILKASKGVIVPKTRDDLIKLALGNETNTTFEVQYEVEGRETVLEAVITKCKNGAVVNYVEDYMRRRDPNCLLVSDKKETDKPKYEDVYSKDFESVREETFEWLKKQKLIFYPFKSGGLEYGYDSILIAPSNAGFFAAGLADLQGFLNIDEISEDFKPRAIIFLAPPFRHTHFEGKQIVIHNRLEESIRNMIGALLGGAQTGSIWRSFLIPLYMVKRPMRICAVLLGLLGILASITVVPIQVMSYPPLVWSVLLFGIFIPFTIVSLTNVLKEKKVRTKSAIIFLACLGVLISPIITWITSVLYEKTERK